MRTSYPRRRNETAKAHQTYTDGRDAPLSACHRDEDIENKSLKDVKYHLRILSEQRLPTTQTFRETTMEAKNSESIQSLIQQLQIEHRDMDDVISRLNEDPHVNQIRLRRLKKRKLMLKDRIEKLKSQLIPDLNA